MSIDINKIIQESVQSTIKSGEEETPEVENLEETATPETENLEEGKEKKETTETVTESFDPAVASAISAGLGALTFRNHIRAAK